VIAILRDRWTHEWRTAPAELAPLLAMVPTVGRLRVVRPVWRRG
jgi:hypothetical protein